MTEHDWPGARIFQLLLVLSYVTTSTVDELDTAGMGRRDVDLKPVAPLQRARGICSIQVGAVLDTTVQNTDPVVNKLLPYKRQSKHSTHYAQNLLVGCLLPYDPNGLCFPSQLVVSKCQAWKARVSFNKLSRRYSRPQMKSRMVSLEA